MQTLFLIVCLSFFGQLEGAATPSTDLHPVTRPDGQAPPLDTVSFIHEEKCQDAMIGDLARGPVAVICDGHGKHGNQIARSVARALHREFSKFSAPPTEAEAHVIFSQINDLLKACRRPTAIPSVYRGGTTALVAFKSPAGITTYNAGDTAAWANYETPGEPRTPPVVTPLHNIDNPDEEARILLSPDCCLRDVGGNKYWSPKGVVKCLAPTRGFGDFEMGPQLLVEPAVRFFPFQKVSSTGTPQVMSYFVMASDGLPDPFERISPDLSTESVHTLSIGDWDRIWSEHIDAGKGKATDLARAIFTAHAGSKPGTLVAYGDDITVQLVTIRRE